MPAVQAVFFDLDDTLLCGCVECSSSFGLRGSAQFLEVHSAHRLDTAANPKQFWGRGGPLPEGQWSRLVKARVPGSANPDQYLHADWQGTVLASSSASGVGLVQNYPPRAWGQDSTTLAPFSWLGNHGYWYEGQLARTLRYVRARWYAEADPHEF